MYIFQYLGRGFWRLIGIGMPDLLLQPEVKVARFCSVYVERSVT